MNYHKFCHNHLLSYSYATNPAFDCRHSLWSVIDVNSGFWLLRFVDVDVSFLDAVSMFTVSCEAACTFETLAVFTTDHGVTTLEQN
jgi:hypothetical protein